MRSHSKTNEDSRLAMPGLIDVKAVHYKAVNVKIALKTDAFRLFLHQKETLYTTGYLRICFLTTGGIYDLALECGFLYSNFGYGRKRRMNH